MSNICAGIGRGQMEVLEERVAARRDMTHFYVDLFKAIPGVEVLTEPNPDYFSNHWLAAILVDPAATGGKTREDLRLALEAENIESRPLWKPMHLQPVFADCPFYTHDVEGNQPDSSNPAAQESISERLFVNGLCLPSGSNLTDQDRERIATVIEHVFF